MYALKIIYSDYKNQHLFGRYLTYKKWLQAVDPDFNHLRETVGHSVLGHEIDIFTLGKGPIKVLMWSQMHGNESTTTKALADLFCFLDDKIHPLSRLILAQCTLVIIPVLNPDGALAYTRFNLHQVDLNRDAQALTQPESKILRKVFNDFQPHWCFNLHDQRTIFSAGDQAVSSTVSFLSPAANAERNLTPARISSMQLIALLNQQLQSLVPGGVGRYSDAFNLNCVGDTFQAMEVPTLLFEAGHYPNDYSREITRQLIFKSLVFALESMAIQSYHSFTAADYFEIPENEERFCDVLVQGLITRDEVPVTVEIQYKEVLENERIRLLPYFKNITHKTEVFGHKTYVSSHSIDYDFKEFQLLIGNELTEKFYNCVKILNTPVFC